MTELKKTTPSLLEDESRGGETAQAGFTFQDGVIAANLARWLAHDGFEAVIKESIGDIETRFFIPSGSRFIHLTEVKDHSVTPAEFWTEIDRFKKIADGSADTYRGFTLVCTGLSAEPQSVVTQLNRVRKPISFYGELSPIVANSLADFRQFVRSKGKTDDDADFLYNFVNVEADWSLPESHARAVFTDLSPQWISALSKATSAELNGLFSKAVAALFGRSNSPIHRREVESLFESCPLVSAAAPFQKTRCITLTDDGSYEGEELPFHWKEFMADGTRTYPAPAAWNERVVDQLGRTKTWIEQNRATRRIELNGNRRLSTSVAIGRAFPAVSGFVIDMNFRGQVWATDAFPPGGAPAYNLTEKFISGTGEDLVVAIGIPRDIECDLSAYVATQSYATAPKLIMHGSEPVLSAAAANQIVGRIKSAIATACGKSGTKTIHLFLATPSPIAVFLGHRLNALAAIQCYEWIGGSAYTPACTLKP